MWTYTYEANLNSEACAPLDPASSFLNHMMLVFLSSLRFGTWRRSFRIKLQKIWTPRTEVSMNYPSGVWQQSELMQITLSFDVFNVLFVGLFSAQIWGGEGRSSCHDLQEKVLEVSGFWASIHFTWYEKVIGAKQVQLLPVYFGQSCSVKFLSSSYRSDHSLLVLNHQAK